MAARCKTLRPMAHALLEARRLFLLPVGAEWAMSSSSSPSPSSPSPSPDEQGWCCAGQPPTASNRHNSLVPLLLKANIVSLSGRGGGSRIALLGDSEAQLSPVISGMGESVEKGREKGRGKRAEREVFEADRMLASPLAAGAYRGLALCLASIRWQGDSAGRFLFAGPD
jgi:hypothetical protein